MLFAKSVSDWSLAIWYPVHIQAAKCVSVLPSYLSMINSYNISNQKREVAKRDESRVQTKSDMVEMKSVSNVKGVTEDRTLLMGRLTMLPIAM